MTRRIVALNNHGVECLHFGRFREAILSFRHAIECIKYATELTGGMQRTHGAVAQEAFAIGRIPIPCVDDATAHAISPHNTQDVYRCAFLLPKTYVEPTASLDSSTVVIYNLALAHHLAGLSGGEESEMHLKEAFRHYDLAFALFKNRWECSSKLLPLLLGVLSNLAHICAHFYEVPKVHYCLDMMKIVLDWRFASYLTEADEDFFYLATSMSSESICSAPAAAA